VMYLLLQFHNTRAPEILLKMSDVEFNFEESVYGEKLYVQVVLGLKK